MNKYGVHGLAWSGTWAAAECERAISARRMDLAVQARRCTGEWLATARDAAS